MHLFFSYSFRMKRFGKSENKFESACRENVEVRLPCSVG